MPVTPIQRLSCALRALPARQRTAAGKFAGVNDRAVQRAAAEVEIRADHYLKLCAAIGINSMTGAPAPVRKLGDLDWKLMGLGIEMTRRICLIASQREMVARIGNRVSLSMVSRIENGQPVSISGVIAICKFIGTTPEQYCASAEMFHVQPKTETRARASA